MLYDRIYRTWHNLDGPGSEVGPVLRVEIRRSARTIHLADGTVVRPGDRIGILHLNNDRVAAIHPGCSTSAQVGFEFRRQLVRSLAELAALTAPGRRFAAVRAFAATTIFHSGLRRLGFAPAIDSPPRAGVVALYQRALLATLHPAGRIRVRRGNYRRSARLWISRSKLRARYGKEPAVIANEAGEVRGAFGCDRRAASPPESGAAAPLGWLQRVFTLATAITTGRSR